MKWAQEVTHPDQIPILVRRAFHDCQTAPTGPVFLSLPMDIMEQMTAVDIGEVSTIDRAAVAGSLDRLAEYLAAIAALIARRLHPHIERDTLATARRHRLPLRHGPLPSPSAECRLTPFKEGGDAFQVVLCFARDCELVDVHVTCEIVESIREPIDRHLRHGH